MFMLNTNTKYIYLGSTLIPKVEGACDADHINLGNTSNTHRHLALSSLHLLHSFCFELPILATEPVSNTRRYYEY